MPLYEYYCPKCASKYELLRPMARCDEPGTCPGGHGGGARVLSPFAVTRDAPAGTAVAPSGAGCACGGGGACGCAS